MVIKDQQEQVGRVRKGRYISQPIMVEDYTRSILPKEEQELQDYQECHRARNKSVRYIKSRHKSEFGSYGRKGSSETSTREGKKSSSG
jgi:hypothetical protein